MSARFEWVTKETLNFEQRASFLRAFVTNFDTIKQSLIECRKDHFVDDDEVEEFMEQYYQYWDCARLGWIPTKSLLQYWYGKGLLKKNDCRRKIIEFCDDYFGFPHAIPLSDDELESIWRREEENHEAWRIEWRAKMAEQKNEQERNNRAQHDENKVEKTAEQRQRRQRQNARRREQRKRQAQNDPEYRKRKNRQRKEQRKRKSEKQNKI